MGRPKTKGETICFRLPTEADAELRRRAENDGLTVSAWLEAKLTPQLVAPTYRPAVENPRSTDVEPRWKK